MDEQQVERAVYRAMQRQKPGIVYQVFRAIVMVLAGIAVFFLVVTLMYNMAK